MTTKYFPTIGEAYAHASIEGNPRLTYTVRRQGNTKIYHAYCLHVFDMFGEFLGVLQEDGTVQKENPSTGASDETF